MEYTANTLTDGVKAKVIIPVHDKIFTAVVAGDRYVSLVENIRAELVGNGKREGLLSRYTKKYATTALSMANGKLNLVMAKDLGLKWYRYEGGIVENSREFCIHMTKKEYIHESEFETVLSGNIDGNQVQMYNGLPRGMIEGTTHETFVANRGGYNCQHVLVAVSDDTVPKYIRDRIEV